MSELPLVVEDLAFRYRTRPEWALADVAFEARPGEILLVAGSSGSGKTTLARSINGLIPRSYRGERKGRVLLRGSEITTMAIPVVAQTVGTLLQDPERQIVASSVLHEIAFGPENLGLPRVDIFRRVGEVARRLHIEELLERETFHLSGGEKQKVALAGLLAMNPAILLLDEPLASLDPASAHEALAIFRALADEGTTIILIEHRVEDALAAKPDRLLYLEGGRISYLGPIDALPPKINYRDVKLPAEWIVQQVKAQQVMLPARAAPARASPGEPLIVFEDVSFRYADDLPMVLQDVNLTVHRGDMVGVLGPNGAGKSTLVKHVIGLLKPTRGRVLVNGHDTRKQSVAQIARKVGFAFQSPAHMLYAPTVREELRFGPSNLQFSPEDTTQAVAESISVMRLGGLEEYPPLGLSFGQQKRTTIAAVIAMRSQVLIMDEPTAGQDFSNYTHFMKELCGVENGGRSLLATKFDASLFITHDLDLVLTYANRVLLVGDGRIVADGRPETVLADTAVLRNYRVLPTSLLELNLRLLPKTGRFLPADELAAYV